MPAAIGGLAYGQLVFIHVAHHAVGAFYLGDLAKVLARVPLVNLVEGALGVLSRGPEVEFSVEQVRICRVGYHGAPVGGSALGYEKIGAGLRLVCPEQ